MRLFLVAILTTASLIAANAQQVRKVKISELQQTIAESDTPLVINFWATFCKPCMEEMPYFEKLAGQYKKTDLAILLVSLDMKNAYPARVEHFLEKQKITIPTVWLDETNADYFCPRIDEAWSGAIPATLFINRRTGYRKFTEQALSASQLQAEIQAMLGKN